MSAPEKGVSLKRFTTPEWAQPRLCEAQVLLANDSSAAGALELVGGVRLQCVGVAPGADMSFGHGAFSLFFSLTSVSGAAENSTGVGGWDSLLRGFLVRALFLAQSIVERGATTSIGVMELVRAEICPWGAKLCWESKETVTALSLENSRCACS